MKQKDPNRTTLPKVGLNLLMGDTAIDKFANLLPPAGPTM